MAANPITTPGCIRFGDDFVLDLRAYELRSGGLPLKLRPIAMQLLLFLIERKGELVTREEIVERIWGKAVFLDTDNSINGAINKLRQALRDNAEQPRFIQTVTGKGYRFIAPVSEALTNPESRLLAEVDVPPEIRIAPKTWRVWLTPFGLALVLLAIAIVGLRLPRYFSRRSNLGSRVMLAVLPFENLTGDPGQDYFVDGMTEEMITRLGNLNPEHLGVIARTSVMYYKQKPKQLDQIGRELGVQYILEGSIRREDTRARITAQFIRVSDQSHVWARQYDRELTDVLSVQGEIATEIADDIQLTLEAGKRTELKQIATLTPQAYAAHDLYLRGQYFWNRRTRDGFQQAIEYFQKALKKDPNYARAYAGLADTYALMSNYGLGPANEYMPKARTAGLRALEIDNSLAEAHTALAAVAENYDWDWPTAEREYQRAIALNANYATAHHWYAECLAFQGRFDEALRESERARELDPLSLIIAADDGAILYFARQYDRAEERFRYVLDMEPGFTRGHLVIAAYVEQHKFREALADIENWRRTDGDAPWISAWEAYVYGRSGNLSKARSAFQKVERLNRKWGTDPIQFMVLCYAGINDNDRLLDWLEKAAHDRSNVPTGFKVDPLYDPFRGDPRFQALLQRAGLAN